MILGGLDNREARVAINQAAARAGKVWIDGAIERLDGVARVFDPATGPCYECTMGENDWKMLEARRSCALLSRGEMEQGKVPTTPTTASIIAGIQVQEAVKYLHGLETHRRPGVRLRRHPPPELPGQLHPQGRLPGARGRSSRSRSSLAASATTRVGDLLERVRSDLGPEAVIETGRDLLALAALRSLRRGRAGLRLAGQGHRGPGPLPPLRPAPDPAMFHTIDGRRPRAARQDPRPRSASRPGTSWAAAPAWNSGSTSFDGDSARDLAP